MRHTPDATGARAHRILVVDDEPDVERLVRQRMRRDVRAGKYVLEFAQNGLEALDRLREGRQFDMVLSDINMPRMDGLTLLSQIPSVDPDVRAVIVSAYGDMKNIRTAMNRGAFDFVTKPIDFDDLRITIDRTITNLQQWREALASRDRLVVLENELSLARRMQESILPKDFGDRPGYSLFADMQPARAVGGDFYDVVRLPNERTAIAIADVSGKGVPAALFMMSSRIQLRAAALGRTDPGAVLDETNNLLNEDNAALMFVTVLFAIFDPEMGELTYACGGHDAPLVVHPDGSAHYAPRANGIALGVSPNAGYDLRKIVLQPGETAVLFTDGVTEARNESGEMFGLPRLKTVFEGAPPAGAKEATAQLFRRVREFAGDVEQFDDITVVALQRNG